MEINKKKYKELIDFKSIKLKKLEIKFDITTLNMIISFIYKDSVLRTRKTLSNIYKLFTNLDESIYEKNQDLKDRIWIIQKTLYGKLVEGFETNNDYIIQYCKDDIDCTETAKEILDDIPNMVIRHDESKYLIKKLDDTLEFGYVITIKEIIKELIHQIDDGDFKSYKGIQDDLYAIATGIINIKRNTTSLGSDQTFSLQEDIFDQVIEDAVQRLQDRNRIFKTGIQLLNIFLSPGFMSKRVYIFLGFPGGGKSTILLKCALDIRKYNTVETKDPDKRPAVLFLNLENGLDETIERIYNMTVDNDDIRNYTPKQIKKRLKREGQLTLTGSNNIDIIIKEYKNRELDTDDLYSIINDLADEGIEVVALIVDYLKRIRPAERASDEKGELKNITNELKDLSKALDICVITAHQLNRAGAAVVDAALQANKEDVTRLVGRDSIGSAWEIQENADMTIIINQEIKQDTGELFLTFKLLKRRYRAIGEDTKTRRLDYFNQPFEEGSEIRLKDDVNLEIPLGLTSLSTQFVALDQKRGPQNMVEREKQKTVNGDEFDIFDVDRTIY